MIRRASLALALAALLAAPVVQASTITIVNNDAAGEGFNDPTPAAPVGGNSGTTVGQQRLIVAQTAANIWGALLPSSVTMFVNSTFDPLTCTATSGVLGSTGATGFNANFAGAILPNTWYHVAEANRLSGVDLNGPTADMNSQFNSALGTPTCLPTGWYYGLDGNEGVAIELLAVMLHEMGHGLGFSSTTNGQTGNQLGSLPNKFPGNYGRQLLDNTTGFNWEVETAAQRAAASISCGKLVWSGVNANSWVNTLGPIGVLQVTAPPAAAGTYQIGTASFGPAVNASPVTGPVTLVNDGTAPTSDGCELLPAGSLTGQIALIDRGTCTFVAKAGNAQQAGAIGVIIVNNAAGCPPPGLGGADPTITIPVVSVSQSDGAILKANLVGQMATLVASPSSHAGSDGAGHLLMYTPNPYQGGSSVSHWDVSAFPDLLMEPAINTGLHNTVDATLNAMADLGWLDAATPIFVAPGHVQAGTDKVTIEFYSAFAASRAWTSYRMGADGVWQSLGAPQVVGQGLLLLADTNVKPGESYSYRVGAQDTDGQMVYSATVNVTIPSGLEFALLGATPNPASGNMLNVSFSLPSFAKAQLQLVSISGRVVRDLDLAGYGAGRHTIDLSQGAPLHSGMYFARLSQGGKTLTAPVTIVQ
jgi:hypothetical protein